MAAAFILPPFLRGAPSAAEEARLRRAMSSDAGAVVSRVGDVEVLAQSIKRTLGPTAWLDDQAVSAALALVAQERDTRLRAFAFDTFFYAHLVERGHATVKHDNVLRRNDVLLFPVNLGNTHWVLVAFYTGERLFLYFDSLGAERDVAKAVVANLKAWVAAYAQDRDQPAKFRDPSAFRGHVAHLRDQQANGYDCGVFVVAYAACVADDCDARACNQLRDRATVADVRKRIALMLLGSSSSTNDDVIEIE